MFRSVVGEHLESCLRRRWDAPGLALIELTGERPAVDLEREPWIGVKYGTTGPEDWCGVVPATVRFQRTAGAEPERLDLIVKISPRDGLARNLIPWILDTQQIQLDRPYLAFRNARETDATRDREEQVYEHAQQSGSPFAGLLPTFHGSALDAASGQRVLFMENVGEVSRLDAAGREGDWPFELIDRALTAVAGWQSLFWGVGGDRLVWAAPRMTTADMVADTPLWQGLLDDGAHRFPDVVTAEIRRRRQALIDTIASWHPAKDLLPTTLTHNDFNNRNVGFRPQPLVLDWELAQRNTAHRDGVELLTFVLPRSATRQDLDELLERHRSRLPQTATAGIDRAVWRAAFAAEVKAEAINRLGLQGLFQAAFPLPYFRRINDNVERLLDLVG